MIRNLPSRITRKKIGGTGRITWRKRYRLLQSSYEPVRTSTRMRICKSRRHRTLKSIRPPPISKAQSSSPTLCINPSRPSSLLKIRNRMNMALSLSMIYLSKDSNFSRTLRITSLTRKDSPPSSPSQQPLGSFSLPIAECSGIAG